MIDGETVSVSLMMWVCAGLCSVGAYMLAWTRTHVKESIATVTALFKTAEDNHKKVCDVYERTITQHAEALEACEKDRERISGRLEQMNKRVDELHERIEK